MKLTDHKEILEFERNIKVGDKVRVCWTNSYNYYAAVGTITKINQMSVRTSLEKLEHAVYRTICGRSESNARLIASAPEPFGGFEARQR